MRVSIGTRITTARPRAWDCFQDFFTDLVVYPDCSRDEAYAYGPTRPNVTRVVITYNYGRRRRAVVAGAPGSPGRLYIAALSHLRAVRRVKAYARGGRLVEDVRVGSGTICR